MIDQNEIEDKRKKKEEDIRLNDEQVTGDWGKFEPRAVRDLLNWPPTGK